MTIEHPEIDPFQPRAYQRPAERIDAMQLLDNSTDAGGPLPTNSASITAIAGWLMAYGFEDFRVTDLPNTDLFGLEMRFPSLEGPVVITPGDYVIRANGQFGYSLGGLSGCNLLGDAKRYGIRQVRDIGTNLGALRDRMADQLQLDSGCARREIVWLDPVYLDDNLQSVDRERATKVSIQCQVDVEVSP